jgi:hypothetical protein
MTSLFEKDEKQSTAVARTSGGSTLLNAAANLSATAPVALAGNQAVQRFLRSGQAVGHVTPMQFPYGEKISGILGRSAHLSSILDKQGCASRGTPAFTEGMLTHFATETPSLHVAAHEAAHQFQHAGITRDAGLGPERHAGAVADAVVAGHQRSALIGDTGSRVQSAARNYVFTDRNNNWRDIEPGAAFKKLGEMGATLTASGKEAYATPDLISQAAGILGAKKSGISISAGAGGPTVEAPDGSGFKTLSRIDVKMDADATGETFYGDCREAAREVMGGPTKERLQEKVVASPGGLPITAQPPNTPLEMVALVIFLDQRIRETPGYETMTDDEKLEVARKAYEDFGKLSDEEKEALKKTPVGEEMAKRLGIDQYAAPEVGEAFATFKGTKAGMDEFHFHYATVIIAAGPDRVTLENAGGNQGEKTTKWKIETYGPAVKKQSFHEEFARKGEDWHTVRVRTSPPPPSYAAEIPGMSTTELFKRYRASTNPDEMYYLELELKKRRVYVNVEVDETKDWMGDEVYVLLSTGGGLQRSTGTVKFDKGQGHTFTMPLTSIWPVNDPLYINVFEFDYTGDVRIGYISWASPYHPQSDVEMNRSGARYRVTISLGT